MSSDWHVAGLTVKQVADRMQIAPSAVRWYADQGLLPCERVGKQRRFFADVLCRVAMIRAAQRVGLSLREIREGLSALPPRQAPTRRDWDRLAGQLRAVLNERIDELLVVLDDLDSQQPDRTRRYEPALSGMADSDEPPATAAAMGASRRRATPGTGPR